VRPFALAAVLASTSAAAGEPRCGDTATTARHVLEVSRAHASRPTRPAARAAARVRAEGDVAVLEDRLDLVIRRNPFDLDGAGLRLSPRGDGYAAARVDRPVEAATLALANGADGAAAVDLPFPFPFFGRRHDRVFVHADGSIAFGAPADTGRDLGAFAEGPPRVAALLADLDPARGGSVGMRLEAGRAAFTWRDVPGAAQLGGNTFGVVLHADGAIDLAWERVETREAIVGVTAGGGAPLAHADLGAGAAAPGALVERFHESEELDLAAAVRRFLAEHGDRHHQVVVYTTRALNPLGATLAFQVNVRNAVRGIGLDVADDGASWGSPSALESVVFMDAIDTFARADAFEILGHEIGHRWLARARHRDAAGPSTALLGRGLVHWSFFAHTSASVMEGNEITDLGGGRFRTGDIARRFSPLDQYLMGLRPPAEVPAFFHVEEPDEFRPERPYKASSGPEPGVTFTGVRRDVTVADVIAALGPREPPGTPLPWRVAFVLVADDVAPATPERVAIADRIRSRLSRWYADATDGRGTVDTSLR
jgi:hypothetical protein